MTDRRRSIWGVGVMLAVVALGGACKGRRAGEGTGTGPEEGSRPEGAVLGPEVPFEVRPESLDVVFTWFDAEGGAHTAGRVDEVPVERRGAVRVDPSRPELRRPGWVYVADLRRPGSDGSFAVQSVRAEVLAQRVMAQAGHTEPLGTQPPAPVAGPAAGQGAVAQAGAGDAAVAGQSSVIVYGASWCSACHQAAAYLRQRHVAFVEKDIEQDPAAAREMAEKAQRAGVPTGSIPILDVRGTILRGFSPPAIEAALQAGG